MKNIKLIKTDEDYYATLDRINELFDAKVGTPESDELDVLVLLIENFEDKHFPIEVPDPIEAIQIRMEELNFKQKDLVGIIGGKSRVSEILNRKKSLTVTMIRNLTQALNLPAEILVRDYKLR